MMVGNHIFIRSILFLLIFNINCTTDSLKKYSNHDFGIDISNHNGYILWDSVFRDTNFKIKFVFIKATEGSDFIDKRFKQNLESLKKFEIEKGSYHYYKADVNSEIQFNNYKRIVDKDMFESPPILDIEELPTIQSKSNWIKGILNWLKLAESYYGKKPIIYSGDVFYKSYLTELSNYDIWIANYNNVDKPITDKIKYWQFTDKGKIKGIKGYVDLNIRIE